CQPGATRAGMSSVPAQSNNKKRCSDLATKAPKTCSSYHRRRRARRNEEQPFDSRLGRLLVCMGSVLVKSCTELAESDADLRRSVVCLQYLQGNNAWSDEEVIEFFSWLHRRGESQQCWISPAWLA